MRVPLILDKGGAMAQQQPLALEAEAFTEGKGWRRGQHLIDALPYVDSLTAEEKAHVDALIEEEVRKLCYMRGYLPRGWHP